MKNIFKNLFNKFKFNKKDIIEEKQNQTDDLKNVVDSSIISFNNAENKTEIKTEIKTENKTENIIKNPLLELKSKYKNNIKQDNSKNDIEEKLKSIKEKAALLKAENKKVYKTAKKDITIKNKQKTIKVEKIKSDIKPKIKLENTKTIYKKSSDNISLNKPIKNNKQQENKQEIKQEVKKEDIISSKGLLRTIQKNNKKINSSSAILTKDKNKFIFPVDIITETTYKEYISLYNNINDEYMKRYFSDFIILNDNKISILLRNNNIIMIKNNDKNILSQSLKDLVPDYTNYIANAYFLITEREKDKEIQNIYINLILNNKNNDIKDIYNYKKLEVII